MAYQVTWSPEAVEDIEEIASHIEKDSSHYAAAVVNRLIDASRRLDELPLRGRRVPELGSPYRERFIYSYRMIYRVEGSEVLIVAVIHGKRLLEPIEDRFDTP